MHADTQSKISAWVEYQHGLEFPARVAQAGLKFHPGRAEIFVM